MLKHYAGRLSLFLLVVSLSNCSVLEYLTTEPGSDLENRSPRDAPSEDRLRSDLVQTARKYIGTRYRAAGTSPNKGFDCSGFTQYVFDKENIDLPRVSRDQAKYGRSIALQDVRPGDLIFFQRSRTGPVFHVSLVVKHDRDELRVVHATTSRGVIEEDINRSDYWQSKVAKARRVIQ
jgi:cell wall-associated NlpC family hydrolase